MFLLQKMVALENNFWIEKTLYSKTNIALIWYDNIFDLSDKSDWILEPDRLVTLSL